MSQNTNYYFDDDRVFSDAHPAQPEAVAPPDNALWIAPPETCPAGSAMVARADRSGWEIVPDYRAVGAYDQQGQWRRVERPGPLPEGWTVEPPPPSPEELRSARIAEIKAALDALDLSAIRPLLAVENGTDEPADHAKLLDTSKQTEMLRAELKQLMEGG